MTTEIAVEDHTPEAPPIVLEEAVKEAAAPPKKDKKEAREADDDAKDARGSALSPEMKALRQAEDRTLRSIIEEFGDHTAYKIRIVRKDPMTVKDRATGKIITTGGFLEWVEGKPIDETWLQEHYGGGTYELGFRKRGPKGGWDYGGQVTVGVAGAPDLRALPGAAAADTPAAAAASGETPTMAKAAFDLMNDQLKRAEARGDRPGDNAVVEILREQLRSRDSELAAMRLEIREVANRQPPQSSEDKFKDRWLEKMVDGDSARVTALRAQYESEIRMIKEAAIENEKRIYDRFERDRQDSRNAHEREIAMLRTSQDSLIGSARAAFETQLAAAKASFDTQKEIQAAENRRLDRDNQDLRADLKELRLKKDKSFVEQAKELETVKEALGIGDGESHGVGEKIADLLTNPEAIAEIGKIIRGPAPAAAPAAAAAVAERPKRRVIRDKTDGKKYIVEADGSRKGPLPERPPQQGPAEPPPIDPETLQRMVVLLENAYSNGTDPDTVSRTAKPHISDQMLMMIRDVGGVDAFLSKVAKLPASSPLLSTQAGRNWVRKVGKGLVGDAD